MKTIKKFFKFIFIIILLFSLTTPCFFQSTALINNNSNIFLPKANDSWFWSDYELISDSSTDWAYFPRIAVDLENNVHIVWYDTTSNLLGSGADIDIFYRSYDSSIETWSPLELVSTESTSSSFYPDIAVDILGNVHVIWQDFTDYLSADIDADVFYKKRTASGVWTTTEVVSTESTQSVQYLTIDTDVNENVYVSWSDPTDILGADADNDIFLRIYNSSSSVWLTTQLVSFESTVPSADSEIKVDSNSGEVHIVWEDAAVLLESDGDWDIFYRSWNIYSSSFSNLELVSTGSLMDSSNPCLFSSQNGDVHVLWDDSTPYPGSGSDRDVIYKKLDSSLNYWTTEEVVSAESTSTAYHSSICCDKNNFVFVAWYDYTDYLVVDTDFDIVFKFKDSFTNKWSSINVLSDRSDEIAVSPDIAVDSSGYISCVWHDDSDIIQYDADPDVYYKKFAGSPSTPTLANIYPNPTSKGNVSLNWSEIYSAVDYLVFRDTSYIWSVSEIDPLAVVTEASFTDLINETGVYYYVIYARNEYGSSNPSNVVYIEIIEESETKLFASLSLAEILIMAGVVLGLQIIVSVITYSLGRSSSQAKKGSSKRKK